MSLVHEALLKAEREKQRKAAAGPGASANPPLALTRTTTTRPASVELGPVPPREIAATPTPAAANPAPAQSNQFLLPVLISCVAIVALVALMFLIRNATSSAHPSAVPRPTAAVAVSAPIPKSTVLPNSAAPRTVSASVDSAAPVNPPPLATAPANDSKYKLSGIMKDPDGKYVAVLNGRIAYEGYYIDGATVKKIDHDYAVIESNGREQVLRLF